MKLIKPSCKACQSLAKAIDAYIAKADNNLEDELDKAGYVDAKDSVKKAGELEDELAEILSEQNKEIAEVVRESKDLKDAEKSIDEYFDTDLTGEVLNETFTGFFTEEVQKLANDYMKETEGDLTIPRLRARTMAWIDDWAERLTELIQLSTEDWIGDMLQEAMDSTLGVDSFARKLEEEGIRYGYRARRAALTEMLRAHSVARQESIMQSPATDRKKWRHSGSHKNKPRENHVAMDGQIVPKTEPFEMKGKDGAMYYPMFPRDTILPPGESINCHCVHVPVSNDDILGLSYEERKQMQMDIIAADDGEWEKELDEANRLRSSVGDNTSIAVSGDTSLMKPRLRAGKTEEIVSFTEKGKIVKVNSRKVNGSQFEMYVDTSEPSKKLLRLVETNMSKIAKGLPEDMELPKILICDFDSIPISSTAIGGYNKGSNLLLFNSKYNTRSAVTDFLTEIPGWFANTNLESAFLHETGHAFHNYLISRIARLKNIEYREAKRLFDSRVRTVIKEMSYQNGDVVKTQLSGYSNFEFTERQMSDNVDEIMAEWYTVKDRESNTQFVDRISEIVREVMSDDGLQ